MKIPLHRLLVFIGLVSIGYGFTPVAQAEIIHYKTTFTVGPLQSPSAIISPSDFASGDQFELHFSIDNTVAATSGSGSSFNYEGLFTSFSLISLPGNTSNFAQGGGSFTLAPDAGATLYNNVHASNFVLSFRFTESPIIDFLWSEEFGPGPGSGDPESVQGQFQFQLYFTANPAISPPSLGDPFSGIESILTTDLSLGNTGVSFALIETPWNQAFFSTASIDPITVIPEPNAIALLGIVAASFFFLRKRKRD